MLAPAEKNLEIPISVPTEQALLGAVMLSPDAYFSTASILDADCFAESLHASLWTKIADMIEGGRKADPVSIIAGLGKDATSKVGDITLQEYVVRLAANAITTIMAPQYATTIRDLYQRRRLIAFGQSLAYDAAGGLEEIDIETLIGEADAELAAIQFGRQTDGVKWLHEAAQQALTQTEENYQARDKIKVGLETGIEELDQMIGPMMGGDLITLAAPSGHGKTALVTQILCAAAQQSLDANRGRPAFFVSQEMQAAQIARRVIASWTGISTRKQRAGEIDISQHDALVDAAKATAGIRILFDESGAQKASAIARKARAMKRLHNIGVMAIDHLLLLKPEHPRDSQVQTIERAVVIFKSLAKELDIVVFQLAQLTRESQKGTSWRFTDQALFGGDAIKQNSDVMLALTIPIKWLRQRKPDDMTSKEGIAWLTQYDKWVGKGEIGTLKVRDGDDGDWSAIDFEGSRMIFGSR